MTFARRVFFLATLFGLAVLPPMFFLEGFFSRQYPPAITHPEFYYGFVGSVFAWQLAYGLVAWDPLRYRPIMLLGVLCKLAFFVSVFVLVAQRRVPLSPALIVVPDAIFAALFVWAFVRTGRASESC